jgi:hypothetical protein
MAPNLKSSLLGQKSPLVEKSELITNLDLFLTLIVDGQFFG